MCAFYGTEPGLLLKCPWSVAAELALFVQWTSRISCWHDAPWSPMSHASSGQMPLASWACHMQ